MIWWQKILFFLPDIILLGWFIWLLWQIATMFYISWKTKVQMEALNDYDKLRTELLQKFSEMYEERKSK